MVIREWHRAVAHHDESFVGGRWTPLTGEHRMAVIDPSTGALVATVCESSEDDVDAAVTAALDACPRLSRTTPSERAEMLSSLADQLDFRQDAVTTTTSLEMGTPVAAGREHHVRPAVDRLRETAASLLEAVARGDGEPAAGARTPVGVVGAITPWDAPLVRAVDVLAPALAAGCPVVLKPSETTPLDVYVLAEAVESAGLEPGVLGVIQGSGRHVGESLVRHAGIGMIAYSGSADAGRRVSQVASHSLKPLRVEVLRPSYGLVLDDGDVTGAMHQCVRSLMATCGQGSEAVTVVLVPFDRISEAETALVEGLQDRRLGPAHDPLTDIGPLANANQHERARRSREGAALDGAREVWTLTGGIPESGFYSVPAVFTITDTPAGAPLPHIVGPAVCLVPYVDESDAVTRADQLRRCGRAVVWTSDETRGLALAGLVSTPLVDVFLPPCDTNPSEPVLLETSRRDDIQSFTMTRSIRVLRESR